MAVSIIAWVNLYLLVMASLLFLLFYALSVSPAALSQRWGKKAYHRCFTLRGVAMVFEALTLVGYGLYTRFPLPTPLPERFPWPAWLSILLAILIGLPTLWLMIRGMLDAGEETARPRQEHTLYEGIYTRLRHPQALGEMFLWLVVALLLNNPFLAMFSTLYFPIFFLTMFIEENDLLIRYGDAYAQYIQETGLLWPRRKESP